MRYFFHIAYDGTAYRGWQRQAEVTTVQATIEDTLSRILKRRVYCIGCGRTDAKVHASQYFFHIDVPIELKEGMCEIFNRNLPIDISIFEILPVERKGNHAQTNALERTYHYYMHAQKNAFLSNYSALYPIQNLDIEKMRQVVALLPQHQDYQHFCKTPDKHNHTLCQITHASLWSNKKQDKMRFQITGNRFLRGMIRILVSKLIDVGRGKVTIETFKRYLSGKEKPQFMNFAYPQGLYLAKVRYPFIDLPASTDFPEILLGEMLENS